MTFIPRAAAHHTGVTQLSESREVGLDDLLSEMFRGQRTLNRDIRKQELFFSTDLCNYQIQKHDIEGRLKNGSASLWRLPFLHKASAP